MTTILWITSPVAFGYAVLLFCKARHGTFGLSTLSAALGVVALMGAKAWHVNVTVPLAILFLVTLVLGTGYVFFAATYEKGRGANIAMCLIVGIAIASPFIVSNGGPSGSSVKAMPAPFYEGQAVAAVGNNIVAQPTGNGTECTTSPEWRQNLTINNKSNFVEDGLMTPAIAALPAAEQPQALLDSSLDHAKTNAFTLATMAVRSGLRQGDANQLVGSLLTKADSDGTQYLSCDGQALWHQLSDQLHQSSDGVVLTAFVREAPASVVNTGFSEAGVSQSQGITGDRREVVLVSNNQEIMEVALQCGNPLFPGTTNVAPKGAAPGVVRVPTTIVKVTTKVTPSPSTPTQPTSTQPTPTKTTPTQPTPTQPTTPTPTPTETTPTQPTTPSGPEKEPSADPCRTGNAPACQPDDHKVTADPTPSDPAVPESVMPTTPSNPAPPAPSTTEREIPVPSDNQGAPPNDPVQGDIGDNSGDDSGDNGGAAPCPICGDIDDGDTGNTSGDGSAATSGGDNQSQQTASGDTSGDSSSTGSQSASESGSDSGNTGTAASDDASDPAITADSGASAPVAGSDDAASSDQSADSQSDDSGETASSGDTTQGSTETSSVEIEDQAYIAHQQRTLSWIMLPALIILVSSAGILLGRKSEKKRK